MASLLALRGLIGFLLAYVGSSLIWPYGLLMVHEQSSGSCIELQCAGLGGGGVTLPLSLTVALLEAPPVIPLTARRRWAENVPKS